MGRHQPPDLGSISSREMEATAAAIAMASMALEFIHSQPGVYAAFASWGARQPHAAQSVPPHRAVTAADALLTTLAQEMFEQVDARRAQLLRDSCTDCLHRRHASCQGKRYSLGGPCACMENMHADLTAEPAKRDEIPANLRED